MDSLSGCCKDERAEVDAQMYAAMKELKFGFHAEEVIHAIARFHQNSDRVRYHLDLMTLVGNFPKKNDLQVKKTEAKAAKARQEGNQLFTDKKFEDALKCYNESLCFSPVGSDSLSIGYANRSAIYLHAGFFQFCLENIELALAHGYPERLKPKLLQRKEECLARMRKEKDAFELYGVLPQIPLSYPANPKIPFVINALKFKKNEKYGRHVVTTRDLKPGDIISTEPCIVSTLNAWDTYSQCLNCCSQNFYNLKPCPKTTTVMFCSDACADEAWNRFYKYEYEVIDGIYTAVEGIHNVFGIRASIRAFTLFDNIADLKALVDSIDDEGETAFDLDLSQNDERTKFRAFYSLIPSTYKPNTANLFETSRIAAISLYIVKEFTDMKNLLEVKEHEDLFMELLVRFATISQKNSVSFSNPYSPVEPNAIDKNRVKSYGIGINVVDGLLNHSCVPNVRHFSGRHALVVWRPIKAGEQLFDTYGPTHLSVKKADRQEHLLDTYQFECDCVACVKDYPSTNQMQLKGIIPRGCIIAATEFDRNVDRTDIKKWKKKAAATIDTISKFIVRNMHHYPCLDIGVCQETIDNCLHVLYCHKPMRYILAPKTNN